MAGGSSGAAGRRPAGPPGTDPKPRNALPPAPASGYRPPALALRARQRLGKYRIIRRLAQGGFAEVYHAHDTIEGVPVALKVPHAHLVDRALLDAFRAEVRLTVRLDHPNILPIKNAQFIDDVFTIACPLGECTLGERMRRRMALRTRIGYVEQILAALAHAHWHRIIHCDVKPDNLILFEDERLRLTDFGISRVAARTIVASGSGTLGYLAPEQAMGKPTFASDVFALGLIAVQMFSGHLPEWPYEWPPPGGELLRRNLHGDFIGMLRRAIEVDHRKRYLSAIEMQTAFESLMGRDRLLRPPPRKRTAQPVTSNHRGWKSLRFRQFRAEFGKVLELSDTCRRCEGPVGEAMRVCPWCGRDRSRIRGATRHPQRCPRCHRGRKADWSYCPHCYGGKFRRISTRRYKDRWYAGRCEYPDCSRQVLMPFSRYCPWCRRKVRRPWRLPGSRKRCPRCGWGVAAGFWSFCPWCSKELPAR